MAPGEYVDAARARVVYILLAKCISAVKARYDQPAVRRDCGLIYIIL